MECPVEKRERQKLERETGEEEIERTSRHFPTYLHAYERRGKHLVFLRCECVCVCYSNKHLIEEKENTVKL